MSQNTRIVHFVKIKGWFIPEDAASYFILKELGAPLCKVHSDLLPTLEFAMRPKGIRAKAKNWMDDILGPYLDKIGSVWLSKADRKCKLYDKRLIFTAPLTERNKKAINSLDASLTRFFARWGFSYKPVYSEEGAKCKFLVDFAFNPDKNPVIPTVEEQPEQSAELELGFTKIRITFAAQRNSVEYQRHSIHGQDKSKAVGSPFHRIDIFTKVGTEWLPVHTGTFIDNTIGDLQSWLPCMFSLANTGKAHE